MAEQPQKNGSNAIEIEEERTDPGIEPPVPQPKRPNFPPPSAKSNPSTTAPASPAPTASPAPAAASPIPAPQRPNVRMPDLGPLDTFMKDPTITEVMVNDLRNVMIERGGRMFFSGFRFQSIDELNRVMRNILDITGRIVSVDQPYVDVILPDGSRVNIVVPPISPKGPCLTIRKFPANRPSMNDLIAAQMVDQRIAYLLNACVVGRLNMLIAGGTGCGKTTFLNCLTSFIPKGERIVVIEDTPELSIAHENSVCLQTKPQMPASAPVTARELVANALRMRPDRIIVGEVRRAEAMDMLQAMNTGHEGSMTTIHANTPRDALSRLETLCMMASTDLPLPAIRKQITSALDLIIQIRRFRNGTRRVVAGTEVVGMEGDTITTQDVFLFEIDTGSLGDTDQGIFKMTGLVPTFLDRLREHGVELPRNYFG